MSARLEPPPEVPYPERVRYVEGATLTLSDLADEQAWLAGAEELHRVIQHRWGIVRGLELAAAGDGARVGPGIAVDGFGRDLQVSETVVLGASDLERVCAPGESGEPCEIDVWLLYGCELAYARDELSAEPDRVREFAVLRLTAANGPVDPLRPPVDGPVPPCSSRPAWPVHLGCLAFDPAADPPVAVSAGGHFAAQVGGAMASTDGSVELALVDEARPSRRQVTVRVAGADGELRQRLAVLPEGPVIVRGPLAVDGDLRLDPGGPSPPGTGLGALRWGTSVAVPETAAPWRAYRVRAADEAAALEDETEAEEAASGAGAASGESLRFELEPMLEDPLPSRRGLAIGCGVEGSDEPSSPEDPTFHPILTVTPAGQVIVAGDLVVDGTLTEPPVAPDPRDPRFLAEMNNAWYGGMEAGLVRAAPTLGLDLAKDAPRREVHPGEPVLFGYFAANTGTEAMAVTLYDCDHGFIGRKELDPGQVGAFYRVFRVPEGIRGPWKTWIDATGKTREGLTTRGEASLTLWVVPGGPAKQRLEEATF